MKLRVASLSLLTFCLTLAAVPAMAQTVYSNGPINGNINAWAINFGFAVSDTFTLNTIFDETQVTGASFGMWLFPGDTLTSAELSITSGENSGTSYFDQTVSFTQSNCVGNQHGYEVCTESTLLPRVSLSNGTYWLNLQNARVSNGDPVYWDQNFGGPSPNAWPMSLASQNTVGTIPSEAFTVYGLQGTSPDGTTTSVPEPSSIMLLGSGILGLAAMLRRTLF